MTSKFVKVRCSKCKNEQVIFGKAATSVVCLVCGKPLVQSTSGNAKIKAKIVDVL